MLYCPAEDSFRTVLDRMARRVGGPVTQDERPLWLLPLSGVAVGRDWPGVQLDLNAPELIRELRAAVQAAVARLVILDCLRELHSARENESDVETVTMRPLRQLAHELDVLVIVVHRASKGADGAARGSKAIAAACDATAFWTGSGDTADGAEPAPGTPLRATLLVRGRDVARTSVRMELGEDLRFRPAAGEAATGKLWRTAPELAGVLKLPERTVGNSLTALMTDSDRRVTRTGTGSRWDLYRYRLDEATAVEPDAVFTVLPITVETDRSDDPDLVDRAAFWRS